jgi:hypothetical protein
MLNCFRQAGYAASHTCIEIVAGDLALKCLEKFRFEHGLPDGDLLRGR